MPIKQSLLLAFVCAFCQVSAQLSVINPKVENLQNPIGLDVDSPRFSWQLSSPQRNVIQTTYEIKVAENAANLALSKSLLWASGRVKSDASIWVPYTGPALQSGKKYYWQVRVWDNLGQESVWSEPAFWQMGLRSPADWKAKWITVSAPEDSLKPSPMFRKTFKLAKKIASATAYITAHGMYEAFINGKRIGEDYLTPGWTAYQKRLQYQTYDVTRLLQSGENAAGIVLGNGWWRGNIGFSGQRNFYGKDISVLCQIEVVFVDGSRATIVTDESWTYTTNGPIRSSEIYHGETYDSRMEIKDWSRMEFDGRSWRQVAVADFGAQTLIATYNEPVRKHETFQAKQIFRTPRGELVVDFGQNLVGWVSMFAQGKPGDEITIQFAEVLDKEGNFYTDNLRDAKCTDRWILSGRGREYFEPHFTFHGFRYAKISGYPGDLKPENIEAVALYSDMKPAGSFVCSEPLINQLQHNIQWGQRGNFLDVPTDCPQRDERLGWTGDAQAFSRTAMFNFDTHNFFAKWLKDVAADQRADGMVPFVVPHVLGVNDGASTGWADVATIIPWNAWLAYGDKRILEDQYASMKAWVEYMRNKSVNDLWNTGFHFGDWCFYRPADDTDGRSAVTDKYLIAQCFYAHSTQLLINAAQVLGKSEDVETYGALLKRIKNAFQQEYVTPNGRLMSPTQTAYVLALQFDMLPENQRAKAAERLAENVKNYGTHLTTGFLGTPHLCHVLTRFGYNDLAYDLLNQKNYPSWLYPVTKGATTIWERWDGIKPDGDFQSAGMNSFNHYAYGAIGDWMYRIVAGLDTDVNAPGYKMLRIKPHPGGGLSHAAASLLTLYGNAASKWEKRAKELLLDVEIPANTTAMVYLPAGLNTEIMEGGKPVADAVGVQISGAEKGYVILKVGSGKYQFVVLDKTN